jgi:putative tricarboxylic transport membrane protein
MQIKAPKDFWAGVMFIAFGAGFALVARNYDMGTAFRMGPAFFPTVLGLLLIGLGALLLVQSLIVKGTALPPFFFRPIFILTVSIALFGVLLRPIGLVAATIVLVFGSALGSSESKRLETLLLAVALAIFAVAVFHYGLGLAFKIMPWD